jgi:hypothetical protein
MSIHPGCEGCAKPYAEAKTIHPLPQKKEAWLCEECASEQAQLYPFDPDARGAAGRESLTNGQIAERAATMICEYTGVANPDDYNIADLITDIGHICDRDGYNFRAVVRRAVRHWEAER